MCAALLSMPLAGSAEITLEEPQPATRNHGLPLEAPHYPLTHYDIPAVDPGAWRLRIGGHVRRELSLSLAELQERAQVRLAVTMECAGNGRASLSPRALSQPWLLEAVGTAEWGGTPLR